MRCSGSRTQPRDTGPTEVVTDGFSVAVERRPDVVVRATGQLDALGGPLLLACAFHRVRVGLLVDLTGVDFLDAGGLAALAGLSSEARRTGARVRLRCGTRRAVLLPLHLTGLADEFDLTA